MKRIVTLLALLLATIGALRADSDILRWGISAGANITQASGNGPGLMNTGWLFDTESGYYLGLSARLSIPVLNVGLDASFLYSQETVTLASNHVVSSDYLRYFSIPLHLRYDFELPLLAEVLVPYIFAGPQVNLALNDFNWLELASQGYQSDVDPEQARHNTTHDQNWKLDLGFGLILVSHIQIHYNYAIPLTNTFSFSTAFDEGYNNFKLGTHRIGVTYFF